MKYYFVLGIQHKKYKNPAIITIHFGHNFIDEFQLDHDYFRAHNVLPQIETKWIEKYNIGQFLTRPDWIKLWADRIPSMLKVYEIDDSAIVDKLKIKVSNSNSDYSNGFMNNSSLIQFSIVALFKKSLVKNLGEKMIKAFTRFDRKDIPYDPDNQDPPLQYWPNPRAFYSSRKDTTYEESGVKSVYHWMGGSFTAELKIKTKHHTKYLTTFADKKMIGFPGPWQVEDLMVASFKPLLNIYDENK